MKAVERIGLALLGTLADTREPGKEKKKKQAGLPANPTTCEIN